MFCGLCMWVCVWVCVCCVRLYSTAAATAAAVLLLPRIPVLVLTRSHHSSSPSSCRYRPQDRDTNFYIIQVKHMQERFAEAAAIARKAVVLWPADDQVRTPPNHLPLCSATVCIVWFCVFCGFVYTRYYTLTCHRYQLLLMFTTLLRVLFVFSFVYILYILFV